MLKGKINNQEVSFQVLGQGLGETGNGVLEIGGGSFSVEWVKMSDNRIRCFFEDRVTELELTSMIAEGGDGASAGVRVWTVAENGSHRVFGGLRVTRAGEADAVSAAGGGKKTSVRIKAQMPGKIVKILVQKDQEVSKNQAVLVMEAMKMENEIKAPMDGIVDRIEVAEGQAVDSGAVLLILKGKT